MILRSCDGQTLPPNFTSFQTETEVLAENGDEISPLQRISVAWIGGGPHSRDVSAMLRHTTSPVMWRNIASARVCAGWPDFQAKTNLMAVTITVSPRRSSPFPRPQVHPTCPSHLQRAQETSTKVSCPLLAPCQRGPPTRFVCVAARDIFRNHGLEVDAAFVPCCGRCGRPTR